jgi:hypothetical protein
MGNATGNATGDRGNIEMIELTKWLGIKLSPRASRFCGLKPQNSKCLLYLSSVVFHGQGEPTTRRAMQKLQRLGHLAYSVFNRGLMIELMQEAGAPW